MSSASILPPTRMTPAAAGSETSPPAAGSGEDRPSVGEQECLHGPSDDAVAEEDTEAERTGEARHEYTEV